MSEVPLYRGKACLVGDFVDGRGRFVFRLLLRVSCFEFRVKCSLFRDSCFVSCFVFCVSRFEFPSECFVFRVSCFVSRVSY